MTADPSLTDRFVSHLSPHSENCQDTDCTWCDTAIAQAKALAGVVRDWLLDEAAADHRAATRVTGTFFSQHADPEDRARVMRQLAAELAEEVNA